MGRRLTCPHIEGPLRMHRRIAGGAVILGLGLALSSFASSANTGQNWTQQQARAYADAGAELHRLAGSAGRALEQINIRSKSKNSHSDFTGDAASMQSNWQPNWLLRTKGCEENRILQLIRPMDPNLMRLKIKDLSRIFIVPPKTIDNKKSLSIRRNPAVPG